MEMKVKRNNRIKELRNTEKSYSEIGKIILEEFGESISRQRVHQIASGYKTPSSSSNLTDLYLAIKVRDNFTCQRCDTKDKALVIHHKDYNASNNEAYNLSTVCKACLGHLVRYRRR